MEKSKSISSKYRVDTYGNQEKDMEEEIITLKFISKDIREYSGAENEPQMQVILSKKNAKFESWEQIFESEIYSQSRIAYFDKLSRMTFDFSEIQELKAQLYDKRMGGNFLIGEAEFTLGEFIGLNDGHLELEMKRSQTVMGSLVIESVTHGREVCYFDFVLRGIKLNNFGIINTISPMVKLWRPKLTPEQIQQLIDGEVNFNKLDVEGWDCLFKSTADGKNPTFKRGIISAKLLCYGYWGCPLRVVLLFNLTS